MRKSKRDFLKSSIPKGKWSVELSKFDSEEQGWDVYSSESGDAICGDNGFYLHQEAEAHLLKEAGNVASKTGMWPEDLLKENEALKKEINRLISLSSQNKKAEHGKC